MSFCEKSMISGSLGLVSDVTFFHSDYMFCRFWIDSAVLYVHLLQRCKLTDILAHWRTSWLVTADIQHVLATVVFYMHHISESWRMRYTHIQQTSLGKRSSKQIRARWMRISSTVGVNNVNYVGNEQFEKSVILRLNLPCSKNNWRGVVSWQVTTIDLSIDLCLSGLKQDTQVRLYYTTALSQFHTT